MLHNYYKIEIEVDIFLADSYESLCRECYVCEVHYPACKSALMPVWLHQPGQLTKPGSVKYALYANVVNYKCLKRLFSQDNPLVWIVDGALSMFLAVKGLYLSLVVLKSNLMQERMLRMLPLQ